MAEIALPTKVAQDDIHAKVTNIENTLNATSGAIKSVQRGTYSMGSSSGYTSISPVDLSKSVLLINQHVDDKTTNYIGYFANAVLNSNSITFRKAGTNFKTIIEWQVIEFN